MRASFISISWMVAAPCNNSQKCKSKKYNGVGGHLFSIAAQRSEEYGYGCAMCGFVANKELMYHYCKTFKAEAICMLHPYQIFISEEVGKTIREVYDYEWTDDTI